LEARGGATLRGREEAQASMEGRVKESEEGLHQWFKVELVWLFFFTHALLAVVYVSHVEDRFFNTPRLNFV
jgi:hypothetical protein